MVVSLGNLLEIWAFISCLHYLYRRNIKYDVITCGIMFVEVILMQAIYFFQIDRQWTWLIYVAIIIYCLYKFEMSLRVAVINCVICIMITGIIQTTLMLCFYSLNFFNRVAAIDSLIINAMLLIIIKIFVSRIKIYKISLALQSNEKIIVLSLLVIIVSVIFCLLNYKKDEGLDVAYYAILIVGVILILVTGVDIGKHKLRARQAERELRVYKLYEKSFQSLIEDICMRQHEFDNHINTIYSQHYLHHTYDALVEAQKKYCKDIVQANSFNKLLSKGNPIVLGFLYGKFSEAEKLGIDVEYKVKIGNVESNVPIYKVIEILGNLLNNAIEALERTPDFNKLKVIMMENQYEITIDVSNECKGITYEQVQNFFKKGYSKKNGNHGYGLYNVNRICEEYKLVLETSIKKTETADRLHFTIIINKPL
ncbi:MAG: GHKL domain-containing protein [Lachnospiraceae bacterium]|nr:GHKL domain-containing protein [Lachnospiraceae bacterium]